MSIAPPIPAEALAGADTARGRSISPRCKLQPPMPLKRMRLMPTSGGASWAWQPTTTIGRSRLRGSTGKALQRWTSDSQERNAMRPPSRSEDSSSRLQSFLRRQSWGVGAVAAGFLAVAVDTCATKRVTAEAAAAAARVTQRQTASRTRRAWRSRSRSQGPGAKRARAMRTREAAEAATVPIRPSRLGASQPRMSGALIASPAQACPQGSTL
mmetsp:Transcript_15439/g.45952  ORF Transcript_15439/g.45952 Transcript_15439/m.45952 type:complete len:212 (-) Transcript_15439:113-748(-)